MSQVLFTGFLLGCKKSASAMNADDPLNRAQKPPKLAQVKIDQSRHRSGHGFDLAQKNVML
jgi:hypothetical protein